MTDSSASFPATRHSIIEALRSSDIATRERALDTVMRVYRVPVIAVLRHRWGLQEADAEDLAHDFFLQALTHDWLSRYDRTRARFRTFLRTCLQAYASTAHEAATRQKRGGHLRGVSLDAALDIAASSPQQDDVFEREWIRSVFSTALDALRAECTAAGRMASFDVFTAIDIAGAESGTRPTYADVAAQLALPVTQVTNFLTWSRRRFRHHVIETLRALTVDDAEFREEARALLGRDRA